MPERVLALCYLGGIGTKRNLKKAFDHACNAHKFGDSKGTELVGTFYQSGWYVKRNECQASEFFIIAAKKGLMTSEALLGYQYFLGKGRFRDMNLAIKYLSAASDKGSQLASYNLAFIYHSGIGEIEINYSKARKYYLEAARTGHASAQFSLYMGLVFLRIKKKQCFG